jgi:SAM-dependent methyltransferase
MSDHHRPRVLVLVVASQSESAVQAVLARVPASFAEQFAVEVLAITGQEDGPPETRGLDPEPATGSLPFSVLRSPVSPSYGQNQKLGFQYAIDRGFDVVVLLHGDGKYAPESLQGLVEPVTADRADAVYGSRMLRPEAGRGMPLYKHMGNRLLTRIQNRLLRSKLTECHSGYRAYSVAALKRIPFPFNVNGLHFDTEVTIQLMLAGQRILETPIPQYHSEEIGVASGIAYAMNVLTTCLRARAQELSLLYDRKFDCVPSTISNAHYKPRLGFESTHMLALEIVPAGARVLDIGCAGGDLGVMLRARGCHVTGVDQFPLDPGKTLDAFHLHDLNRGPLPVDVSAFDYAVMLDVIEHLQSPESFIDLFRAGAERNGNTRLVVSTPNIAFIVSRLMLLAGQFNYGKRGILDITHTRLFTFRTFRRLFEQSGYDVLSMRGVPAPFPLALGDGWRARTLLSVHRLLIRISRSLFAFQIFAVVRPKPGLAYLLDRAKVSPAGRTD